MTSWKSISELVKDVENRHITSVELVERSLARINEVHEYSAIIAPVEERALSRAKEIDLAISKGEKAGRLAGIPFIAKDNFLAFGADTTAASNMLRGFDAPYQATAIEKLEAEGAICVAKANLDAFAHGSSTENSDFMTTHNPFDTDRVAGGSSGGSAAAVALDIAPFALGTDTGGSIRLPASFCGVVGYKPTYGLVSRSGVVAMASSTDVIGPIAKNVVDAALVLDVMSGKDELDGTTINRSTSSYAKLNRDAAKKLKIGIVKEYFEEDYDEEIKLHILDAISTLRDQGVEVVEVSLPSVKLALACYYVICPAEVSSNLSRYDGQRYGYSYKKASTLDESYVKSRSLGFGDEAKRRIMIGTYVLSSGYYDAYYQKAQLVRTKLINEFREAFNKCDILVGPSAPTVAFKIGEKADNPLGMYVVDHMTVGANLTGMPAISVPAGKVRQLPIGLHLIADQHNDHDLLSFADYAEEVLS